MKSQYSTKGLIIYGSYIDVNDITNSSPVMVAIALIRRSE